MNDQEYLGKVELQLPTNGVGDFDKFKNCNYYILSYSLFRIINFLTNVKSYS